MLYQVVQKCLFIYFQFVGRNEIEGGDFEYFPYGFQCLQRTFGKEIEGTC